MIAAVVVALLTVAGAALVARRRLVAVTVDGESMAPTFRDRDRVLVARRAPGRLRRGDVVVVERPRPGSGWRELRPPDGSLAGREWYVKRAVALPGDPVPEVARTAAAVDTVPPAALIVVGDNPRSNDSKQWGLFPADRLLGVVVARLPRRD